MKICLSIFALVVVAGSAFAQRTPVRTAISYVDPFIGTESDGNVFPGASLPFGMVKLGPDCGDRTRNQGYAADGAIQGFSHVHVSGTGGGPKYGNLLVMPFSGTSQRTDFSSARSNETASPGYYGVTLKEGNIRVGLTVTRHAAMHQYRFSSGGPSGVYIDLGSMLHPSFCKGCAEDQQLVGAEIEQINNSTVEGYTRVRGGWNEGGPYTVFFSAVTSKPMTGLEIIADGKRVPSSMAADNGRPVAAVLTFNTSADETVQMKVGISFLGTLRARQNREREIPSWDFNSVKQSAEAEWQRYLDRITVSTRTDSLKTIFYSALYHALLQPTDRSGENPLWQSEQPYYDDYYAIWDTYRATHPLITLIAPDEQVKMVNSLLDIYSHEGYMPDARSGNETGRTQGGSNCDVLIADAWAKGLKGIDYRLGLEAMIKNATVPPGGDERKWGRGGLPDYNSVGYVSTTYERAGSRTVEYAYNDYCIAQVAKGLGLDSIYRTYLPKASNWTNLWKPVSFAGATGFIMPRKANGKWDEDYRGRTWDWQKGWQPVFPYNTLTAGSWPDFFYESHSWEYSLYVPQDAALLIKKCGGKEKFISRLDTFFSRNYFNISNEPGFFTPCLYAYAGRPDKTADVVRNTIGRKYNTGKSGLPGNDDSGSMSAWLVFNSMGFFPNAGQDVYVITAPHFDTVTLRGGPKPFIITARNLSAKNRYIRSATLNGKPLPRAWLHHAEIAAGGTLALEMTNNPLQWKPVQAPPSLSDEATTN